MSYSYIVFHFLISFVFSRITHFIREKMNVTYRMKTNCIDGNVHPMSKTINEVKSHHSHPTREHSEGKGKDQRA